ncbi:MAG: ImmA/IrrE family metallo-endopeptidase [Firmicutes bacterium]|nr:ImmA/IrrE family metallo-endopeptidase [Bacillota bacterium]
MALPSKVKIGPLVYEVQEAIPTLGDATLIGEALHRDGIIRLRTDLPFQQKELTFIHEVLHGIMYVAGFPGGGDDEITVSSEELTSRLAIVLYGFLKDNGFWPDGK